jgi:sphinganine-1-phosphate aldolase
MLCSISYKAIVVCVVVAAVGVMWQSEEYRRVLISEVVIIRDYINALTGRYEGWQVVLVTCALTLIINTVLNYLFEDNIHTLRQRATRFFFQLVRKIPGVQSKIAREVKKTIATMEKNSLPKRSGETYRTELPKKGLSHDDVMKEVGSLEKLANVDWEKGWVSGTLYYSSPELTRLTTAVFEKFVWSNPLHVDVFPHVRKMEAEVVQWTVKLFNGGGDAGGVMTSGGTESIVLAMRAYREWGYERGITYPEIVYPASAHCAFVKAAEYFRMKLVQVRL